MKTVTPSFIGGKPERLQFPEISSLEAIVPSCRKVFGNAHGYHINSISLNSDGETFISADDLRINLWNTEISDQSFNIIDIKPEDMEELSEVITAAAFHPIHCNLFMYSSSKGLIKLNDLRQHSRGEPAKLFAHKEDPSKKSFFSEIISSISDCHFSRDGRFIISRDYLTLSIWDINMDSAPIRVINSNEHLLPKLCDLYESDFIFDKFECTTNFDGRFVPPLPQLFSLSLCLSLPLSLILFNLLSQAVYAPFFIHASTHVTSLLFFRAILQFSFYSFHFALTSFLCRIVIILN